jgi:isoleucyl-tRNA synthetase
LGNLRDQKINFDLNSKEIEKWPELERFMLHQIFILNKNFEKYFKEYNFHKLYKELLNFCSLDLSAFYFDIRKDTLYCDEVKSFKRKACINLLGLILDILLKWFAPILSFTTEEIFQIINQGKDSSIHLETFPNIPTKWENEELFKKLDKLKIKYEKLEKLNIKLQERISDILNPKNVECENLIDL